MFDDMGIHTGRFKGGPKGRAGGHLKKNWGGGGRRGGKNPYKIVGVQSRNKSKLLMVKKLFIIVISEFI
jgi:hypothetical protein